MGYGVVIVNWTAKMLSGEELVMLRDVAVQYLHRGGREKKVGFTHSLCEGLLTYQKDGAFGTFGGRFFEADLGSIHGERWTCEFLLPHGTEDVVFDDESVVFFVEQREEGEPKVSRVDMKRALNEKARRHTLQ